MVTSMNSDDSMPANDLLNRDAAQLRTLLNALPDLVWLKDPNGVFLGCNHRFESYFGAKESDIVGKTDQDFVDIGPSQLPEPI